MALLDVQVIPRFAMLDAVTGDRAAAQATSSSKPSCTGTKLCDAKALRKVVSSVYSTDLSFETAGNAQQGK